MESIHQKTSGRDSVDKASGKRSSLTRPRTSTQRLDDFLSEDLRNFGSRLSTPSISEIGDNHFSSNLRHLTELESDYHDPSSRWIQVGQKHQEKNRVTLLPPKAESRASSSMTKRDLDSRKKVDNLLEEEQDELAMSLSQSKFLMLRNANIERVKADEKWPDLDELKQVEKIKTKFNLALLNGTEEIDDAVPDDTFKDIPDDVFEKIPRAVTARIQNRERKKKRLSSGRPQGEIQASAPPEEGEVAAGGQPVGFIAMLFSGGPVARPGNIDQIEQDFMFALFLQKQEEESQARPEQSGESREREPDLGHFCAPDMPGFCQANFCIFHTKK